MSVETLCEGVEAAMDEAGFDRAHIVGNSLGGYVALHLAARGRATSVVALAPAGGWARGDDAWRAVLDHFEVMQAQVRAAAPNADRLLATPQGRRRATQFTSVRYQHIPAELLAHQMVGVARCDLAPLHEAARREGYHLDAARIDCPVRIVWGTEDQILPWPRAAVRYREDWLPQADWVELEGRGRTAPSSTSRSRRRS